MLYSLGQASGIITLSLLSLQLLLASRLPLFENRLSLDFKLYLHRANSSLILLFALLHPLLVLYPFNVLSFTLFHWLGLTALIMLILTPIIAFNSERLNLSYETWHLIHKAGYLIVAFGFIHSFFLGSTIRTPPLSYWYISIFSIALLAVSYRYLIRPFRFRRFWYTIKKITRLAPNITQITLDAYPRLKYSPGQFVFVKFYSDKLPAEEHHFTLSSSPTEKNLTLTIKASGDFTNLLPQLKIKDKVHLEGPYGNFSHHAPNVAARRSGVVFIAAGIGITPIRANIRHLADTQPNTPITLFYSAPSPKDLVFKNEFDQIKNLKSIYATTQEKSPPLYFGRLDRDFILRHLPNLNDYTFFLCGPKPFTRTLSAFLPNAKIEHFQFK